jgi:hypothetical protein
VRLWPFGAVLVMFSCAKGAGDDGAPTDQASEAGQDAGPAVTYDSGSRDGRTHPEASSFDAAPPPDAGGFVDTGGGGGGGTRTDLCVGQTSHQARDIFGPVDYDDLCDDYYSAHFFSGPGRPCGPTGASCAAYTGSGGFNEYCCFADLGFCSLDYNDVPQCVPK